MSTPPPRGVNAHYAIAAVAVTVLINRRKDIKLIPGLLQRNGGKTRKVSAFTRTGTQWTSVRRVYNAGSAVGDAHAYED